MAVGKDKTRILITVTKELKDKLELEAQKQNRTVANLINTILLEYFKSL